MPEEPKKNDNKIIPGKNHRRIIKDCQNIDSKQRAGREKPQAIR
jgi:hypothetical protein